MGERAVGAPGLDTLTAEVLLSSFATSAPTTHACACGEKGGRFVCYRPYLYDYQPLWSCFAALLVISEGPRSVGNESATIAICWPATRRIGSPPHRAHTRAHMLNSAQIRRAGVADAPARTRTARALHAHARACARTHERKRARSRAHSRARAVRIARGTLASRTATRLRRATLMRGSN